MMISILRKKDMNNERIFFYILINLNEIEYYNNNIFTICTTTINNYKIYRYNELKK